MGSKPGKIRENLKDITLPKITCVCCESVYITTNKDSIDNNLETLGETTNTMNSVEVLEDTDNGLRMQTLREV